MLTRKSGMQLKIHFVTIEDLVPAGHLLRQIDKMIDFSSFMTKYSTYTA